MTASEWSRFPPIPSQDVVSWYWWRENPTDDPVCVAVEKSGSKPPYWRSWSVCNGDGSCAENCLPLNIDSKGNPGVEDGYEEGETFRDGEWWPMRLEPPKED
jgi:hypothetical protein